MITTIIKLLGNLVSEYSPSPSSINRRVVTLFCYLVITLLAQTSFAETETTEDITENLNADSRLATEDIEVMEVDHGITIQATIRYIPLDITEKLQFTFDENSLLRLS